MRSLLLLASIALLLAGCADDGAPAPAPAEAGPQWVETVTEETHRATASWPGWASACPPQPVGETIVFVGALEPIRLDAPEDLTAAWANVTWDPANPTVSELRAFLLDGDAILAVEEGPSPLALAVPAEAAAEVEGALSLYVEPASCPTVPANAATAPEQELEVHATFRHLAASEPQAEQSGASAGQEPPGAGPA